MGVKFQDGDAPERVVADAVQDDIEARVKEHLRTVAQGTLIFDQGDEGETMFFIQKGRVQISILSGKSVQPIANLVEGEFFGEMALLHKEPRTARATALSECQLIEMDGDAFDDFLSTHHQAAINIIHLLTRRLRRTDELVQSLLSGDPQCQVADALLRDTIDTERGPHGYPLSKDVNELMVASGTDARVLKMILSRFRAGGFINVVDSTVFVNNRSRLEQYAAFISLKAQ